MMGRRVRNFRAFERAPSRRTASLGLTDGHIYIHPQTYAYTDSIDRSPPTTPKPDGGRWARI